MEILNGDKRENMAVQSGENRNETSKITRNVAENNPEEPIKKFFTLMGAIATVFVIFFIYMEIRKKGTKETEQ